MAIKERMPEKWNDTLQKELDSAVVEIVDVQEAIDELPKADYKEGYTPNKGTENHVHLKVVSGRRYDPRTGKEQSSPKNVVLTYGEWTLFKNNHKLLGYSIIECLYDPYHEVKAIIEAEKESK